MSEVGGGDEVAELIRQNKVSYIILIGCERLVLEEQLSFADIVKACFELGPRENDALILIDFESFNPEGHLFKFHLGSQIKFHSVAFRVEEDGLLGFVLADHCELKHEAPVNASRYQFAIFFIKVGEVD